MFVALIRKSRYEIQAQDRSTSDYWLILNNEVRLLRRRKVDLDIDSDK